MSLQIALARMAELQTMLTPPPARTAAPVATQSFASTMQSATAPGAISALTPAPAPAGSGTPAGQAILNAVRPEVGVAEQPPGSNDSPRIAQYRPAT